MGVITAFFAALPIILPLIGQFMGLVIKFAEFAAKNNVRAVLTDLEKTFDDLRAADTQEKKFESAKQLADIFRNLGK